MEPDLTAWDEDLNKTHGIRQAISLELSIKRTLARIDRALDAGNKRMFMELCQLLRQYKRQR
jgi:uncharacterized protein YpiB (UPF0302 family)